MAARKIAPVKSPSIIRTEMVRGWPLEFAADQPDDGLLAAKVLGQRLGFSRATNVNRLIERCFPGEKLNEIHVDYIVERTGAVERLIPEYRLNKRQALKVIMRSETPVAEQIQDEIIGVYDAWTAGQLVPALQAAESHAAILAAVKESSQATEARLLAIETAHRQENDALRAELASVRGMIEPLLEHPERLRPLNTLGDDPVKVDDFNTKIDTMVRAWKGAGIEITRKRAIGVVCRTWHPHGNSYLALPHGVMADVMKRIEEWTDKPDASLLRRPKRPKSTVKPDPRTPYLPGLGLDLAMAQKRGLRPN
jgi:hypothetical protein